jgi:hypothetical protein
LRLVQDKVDPDYDGDNYNEKKDRKEEADFLYKTFGDPKVEEDIYVEDEEYLPAQVEHEDEDEGFLPDDDDEEEEDEDVDEEDGN